MVINTEDVRKLDAQGMREKLDEYRKELFNLRFQHATAQLENTARIKVVRKCIARIETIMKEKSEA